MTNTDDLLQVLRAALVSYNDDDAVSAISLADEAMKQIDPDGKSPSLVAFGCSLAPRQMARSLLRKTYEEREEHSIQEDLFGGLQDRYPGTGNHKDLYVPRMQLTRDDRYFNIHRLEREAAAKQRHADALRAETEELEASGFFDIAA
jgi:hypothetical protein